jgi:hypothetical protein
VRAFFAGDGTAIVKIELDVRCFSDDPVAAPYLLKKDYRRLSRTDRRNLIAQAQRYVERTVELRFEPGSLLTPDWKFAFTTFREGPLDSPEDPVLLTGTWRFDAARRRSYRLRALPAGELSVLFLNYYQRKVLKGVQVLFPGEESRALDLTRLAEIEPGDLFEQFLASTANGP